MTPNCCSCLKGIIYSRMSGSKMVKYALIICRREGKYLCVQEKNRQWWIPGGAVEEGETFSQAAIRETR